MGPLECWKSLLEAKLRCQLRVLDHKIGVQPNKSALLSLCDVFTSCYTLCLNIYFVCFSIWFQVSSVQFSRSVVSDSLRPHESQHARPPWLLHPWAPPSIGFSRQEYWSGLPFPSPGDLPDPGIKPESPALQADSLPTELRGKPIST